MDRLNLCIKVGNDWVPVGPDNPLPIASGSSAGGDAVPAPEPAAAVADLPSTATAVQTRAAFNELLASLRAAGVLASSE